jgi:hypothetical protein
MKIFMGLEDKIQEKIKQGITLTEWIGMFKNQDKAFMS